MDDRGHFYFVDTTVPHMIQQALFVPESGQLEKLREFDAIPSRDVRLFAQRFTGNMGGGRSALTGGRYISLAPHGV